MGRSRFLMIHFCLILFTVLCLWGREGEFYLPARLPCPTGAQQEVFLFFSGERFQQFPTEGGSVWMEDKVETEAASTGPCSLFPGFLPDGGM